MTLSTVLHIDHDETVLESRKPHLEAAGFRAVTWPWSASTIPMLRPAPELILLDLDSLDGVPLSAFVVHASRVGGRCVVVVSEGEPGEIEELVDGSGALGWVSKRLDDEAFVAEVRAQLRRKQRFTGRNEPLGEDVVEAIRRGNG